MIVDYHPNDKITNRFLKKALKELKIPIDKLYITSLRKSSNDKANIKLLNYEIDEVKPKIIIAFGQEVISVLLPELKKKKMSDIVERIYGNIIPCYSCSYIVSHGKKEVESFKNCFNTARRRIFDVSK